MPENVSPMFRAFGESDTVLAAHEPQRSGLAMRLAAGVLLGQALLSVMLAFASQTFGPTLITVAVDLFLAARFLRLDERWVLWAQVRAVAGLIISPLVLAANGNWLDAAFVAFLQAGFGVPVLLLLAKRTSRGKLIVAVSLFVILGIILGLLAVIVVALNRVPIAA